MPLPGSSALTDGRCCGSSPGRSSSPGWSGCGRTDPCAPSPPTSTLPPGPWPNTPGVAWRGAGIATACTGGIGGGSGGRAGVAGSCSTPTLRPGAARSGESPAAGAPCRRMPSILTCSLGEGLRGTGRAVTGSGRNGGDSSIACQRRGDDSARCRSAACRRQARALARWCVDVQWREWGANLAHFRSC